MFGSRRFALPAMFLLVLCLILVLSCSAPSPAPAPKPAPAPTPAPAPAPPAPAASGELKFEFVSVTPEVKKGGELVVVGKTLPGTVCTIAMTFANGQASNLVFPEPTNKQTADASGKVEWKGTVARVIIGVTKLDVTAIKDGKTVTASTTFKIIE